MNNSKQNLLRQADHKRVEGKTTKGVKSDGKFGSKMQRTLIDEIDKKKAKIAELANTNYKNFDVKLSQSDEHNQLLRTGHFKAQSQSCGIVTHCSRVDESFIDYFTNADPLPEESKESN